MSIKIGSKDERIILGENPKNEYCWENIIIMDDD
jgi:hypothetical protein